MPLPSTKSITPTYTVAMPISKKKVKYRPWVSIENRTLLTSYLSDDHETIQDAMIDVLTACTFNDVDILSLPEADFGFLFLQVRGKSKGEVIELEYDASKDGIPTKVPVEFNINSVEVTPVPETTITVSDKIAIVLSIPSMKTLKDIRATDNEYTKMAYLVASVHEGNSTFTVGSDYTIEELSEWIGNLPTSIVEKIEDFAGKIPSITATLKFDVMGTAKEIVFSGIQDFLL